MRDLAARAGRAISAGHVSLKAMGDPFEAGNSSVMGIAADGGPIGFGRSDAGRTIAAGLLLVALIGFAAVLGHEFEQADAPALGAGLAAKGSAL
jgi:hypothetical protein